MSEIEPVEFNAESPAWARLTDLQAMLGLREGKSLDKWRDKLGRQHEHTEKRGPHRGVWVYLPAWLPAWADSRRSPAAADPDNSQPTAKQRREEARARLDELQVDERERELAANWVRSDQAIGDYGAVGDVLRACADRMCPLCKQILADGLSDIEQQYCAKNGSAAGHGVAGRTR